MDHRRICVPSLNETSYAAHDCTVNSTVAAKLETDHVAYFNRKIHLSG